MRQVFDNFMVAHVWANRTQDRGRSDNMYFGPLPGGGSALYSYGRHFAIAAFVQWHAGSFLLINSGRYSPSTNKHQNYAASSLSHEQRQGAIRVPMLSENLLHFPGELVQSCLTHALDAITEAFKRRKPEKRDAEIASAVRTLRTAHLIRKLSRVKVKLPNPPAEGADVLEWARRIASATARTTADRLHSRAWTHATQSSYAQPAHRVHEFETYAREMREAAAMRKGAGLPPMRGAAKQYAHVLQRLSETRAAYAEAVLTNVRAAYGQALRDMYGRLRTIRDGCLSVKAGSYAEHSMARVASLARDAGLSGSPVAKRATRKLEWVYASRSLATCRDWLKGAQANSVHCGDCSPELHRLRVRLHGMDERQRIAFIKLHAAEIREISEASARWVAEREQREAAVLAAWVAGKSNERPHGLANPVCRVRGDVVETTLGASVPLEHAVRLARQAVVCLRRGDECKGHRVGHFTVTSISERGAVIGCHTFTAEEMHRMIALLLQRYDHRFSDEVSA